MRTLFQTLQDRDAGFLRVVAEMWGVDLSSGSIRQALDDLVKQMLAEGAFEEQVEDLPPETYRALQHILSMGARVPRHELERDLGPLIMMGPAKRDREKPWRNPASPLEDLWYRSLIGTAFGDTNRGPIEFVYIPIEFYEPQSAPPGEPQRYGYATDEPSFVSSAGTAILEDCTSLLAMTRKDPNWLQDDHSDRLARVEPFLWLPEACDFSCRLLNEMGVLAAQPEEFDPEPVRHFLRSSIATALRSLVETWRDSREWNDLAEVPGITCPHDEWPNDPLISRQAVLRFLSTIPSGEWWDLDSFVSALHRYEPDFQRPAGDFSSWYLQRSNGTFLVGWEHWKSVEGALVRFILTGPLYWLGAVDIGRRVESGPAIAFRLSPLRSTVFGEDIDELPEELDQGVVVNSDGTIRVPRNLRRSQRYQIARFSEWIGIQAEGQTYRISARSLEKAAEQGLKFTHVLSVLEETSNTLIPPKLSEAIGRWFESGTTALLEETIVLRIHAHEREVLQKHRSTARLMGEEIGPNMYLVRIEDWPRLVEAALREGVLIRPPDPR